MTATGTGARSVGERFVLEFCTGNEEDIFQNHEINTVFIAPRHDSHAAYMLESMCLSKSRSVSLSMIFDAWPSMPIAAERKKTARPEQGAEK